VAADQEAVREHGHQTGQVMTAPDRDKLKLLRVPQRMPTREMLIGTLQKLEGVKTLLVIVEDEEGIWIMHERDTTLERLNWMVDRAKRLLHD